MLGWTMLVIARKSMKPRHAFSLTLTMAESQSRVQSSVAALDLIFSCNICQETISGIYAEDDAHCGLRKSDNLDDDRITKLWLTDCAHLTCGKHLEGGGID